VEFLEQRSLIIGHEHIRGAYQTQKNFAASRTAEIECNAFLVAIGQDPTPVQTTLGYAGQLRKEPPEVATARALYFDYFSAKVGHYGRRGRAGHVRSTIDHADSSEYAALVHQLVPPKTSGTVCHKLSLAWYPTRRYMVL